MKAYLKDPSAKHDYSIDWSDWLASDTIATSTWTADAGITTSSPTNTTTATKVFAHGGTAGKTYLLTNTVTTAGGRTGVKTIELICEET